MIMIMIMVTITITIMIMISKLVDAETRALSAPYTVQTCICVHEVRMSLQCNDNSYDIIHTNKKTSTGYLGIITIL